MAKKVKSWTDKLNDKAEPLVKPCPTKFAGMLPGQMMLIPTPRLLDAFLRTIPAGESLTVAEMREALAKRHGAEVTCPVTTGFHLRTVAEAAVEIANATGNWSDMSPFWRVIDPGSATFAKLSFDTGFIRHQRALEGLQ
jgi:hypothetical protein